MDDIMEKEVITQCRKPHGEEGIKTIKSMNQGHDGISNFAMTKGLVPVSVPPKRYLPATLVLSASKISRS